jgi:N-methylhydantoinase A
LSNYRVGGDVGGTFTDVVLAGEDGSLAVKKVLSTPGHFERAMVDGVAELLQEQGVSPDQVVEVLHGTTAATNAVLQRLGAVTGLITTRGFRDVLEMRRLRMPNIYDIFWDKPAPLAPRNLCREVTERLNGQGQVLTTLDLDEVRQVVRSMLEDGVTSLAVCLLHSYINPVHEQAIAELVRREFPDLFLSVSSEVLPEIREYERTSTVVTNAYIMPVMASYLRSMTLELGRMGVRAPLLIVKSSGGMMTARMAEQAPIHSLESGPAAGVRASLALARRLGIKDVVTLDMGGTTAKGSLIENGEAHRASEYEVGAPISTSSRLLKGGGYLLRIRAIDLAEVGAGGGSIVAIDSGGSLQVGPQSAGAVPGPVCYDGGGDQPTVTDANLVLGYLNQEYLLGGSLKVNREKAHRVLDETVAKPLGLPLLEAAYAVHMVSNATMARIIRAVTTERGRDIRNFDLIAFGGNGPVHAAEMARSLGIKRIIVPPVPGLFSALGLLVSPLEQEEVQTIMRPTTSMNDSDLEQLYAGLEQRVAAALRAEGVDLDKVEYSPMADMRSIDQAHELTVAAPVGPSNGQRIEALEESFWQEHLRSFGHRSDQDPTEIVNVRLVARYATAREDLNVSVDSLKALYSTSKGKTARLAYFGREAGSVETPVVARLDLYERATPGPLIVEEYDTTVVVPPGFTVRRDPLGNLLLE